MGQIEKQTHGIENIAKVMRVNMYQDYQIEELLLQKKEEQKRRPDNFQQWYQLVQENPILAPTYFVAEIGLNHNGDIKLARDMIAQAKQAGADAVKFQTFIAEELVHPEVDYMQGALEIFRSCQLSFADFRQLAQYAMEQEIDFLSTPFSPRAVHFLRELYVPAIKVASGDINNFLLLDEIAKSQKPIILSTGASTNDEVEQAISFLHKSGNDSIVLMHCLSEYPAALSRVGWFSIPYLQDKYNMPVGFSDHTMGIAGPVAAFSFGARIVEKHFTLDKNDLGADHGMSADPEEFFQMVQSIREIESGFGTYGKEPTEEEVKGNSVGRRGLYYRSDFPAGKIVYAEDIIALRPQNGFSPADITYILGKELRNDVTRLESVAKEDFIKL